MLICFMFNWKILIIVSYNVFCFDIWYCEMILMWSVMEVVTFRFHRLSYFGFLVFLYLFLSFTNVFFSNGYIWLGIEKKVVWLYKYMMGIEMVYNCGILVFYLMIYYNKKGTVVNMRFRIGMVIFRFHFLKFNFFRFFLLFFFLFNIWLELILIHLITLRHFGHGLPFGRLRR